MTIKVIVEFQSKPGMRGELVKLIRAIAAEHGPRMTGYRGNSLYEVPDHPDMLVEIADWDSLDARNAMMQQAIEANLLAPVMELMAGPFRATVAIPAA